MGVFRRNFFACLHFDINSLFLLSEAILGLQKIKNFSHRHKLHFLLTLEYAIVCLILRHVMSYLMFCSFKHQMCLLSSVAFLYLSCFNEHMWFLYLILKVVSQSPIYVSLETGVVNIKYDITLRKIKQTIAYSNVSKKCNLYW